MKSRKTRVFQVQALLASMMLLASCQQTPLISTHEGAGNRRSIADNSETKMSRARTNNQGYKTLQASTPCFDVVGPNFSVSTYGADQQSAVVTYNSGAHEYLMVWADKRSGTTFDIYAQRLSMTGAALGAAFAVSTAANDQLAPSVAYNSSNDEYMVVWQDKRNGSTFDVWSQRVTKTGFVNGAAVQLHNDGVTTNNQTEPVVACNPSVGYAVAWTDDNAGHNNILAKGLSLTGTVIGTSSTTVSGSLNSQDNPAISFNGNTASPKFLVTWNDKASGVYDIYAQRVNLTTTAMSLDGSSIAVSTATGDQLAPSVIDRGNSEWAVTWQDKRSGNSDIYMRQLSATGVVGPETLVDSTTGDQENPVVAYGNVNSSELFITWQDRSAGPTTSDITGIRVSLGANYSTAGTLLSSAFTLSTAANEQTRPAIVFNPRQLEYVVVWQDSRSGVSLDIYSQRIGGYTLRGGEVASKLAPLNQAHPMGAYDSDLNRYLLVYHDSQSPSGSDIHGLLVDSTGAAIGSSFVISNAVDNQNFPVAAYNPATDQYLVAWQDPRAIPQQIYGQLVNSNGTLSGTNFAISSGAGVKYNPSVVFNGMTGQYFLTWWDGRNGSTNYDIYGQLVNGNGTLSGVNLAIATDPGNQQYPSLAFDSVQNRYIIVWDNGGTVYSKVLDGTGATVFATRSIGIGVYPRVAFNSDFTEYMVTYQSGSYTEPDPNIMGLVVDRFNVNLNGQSEFTVCANTSNLISTNDKKQLRPTVVYRPNVDEYLVAWYNYTGDVFGARILGVGGSDFSSKYFTISGGPNTQSYPHLMYNSTDGDTLSIWHDNRPAATNLEIYSQRVNMTSCN